jgi:hypothetical protein
MTCFTRLLPLAVLGATLGSELPGQTPLPAEAIAHLRPFVGRWDVEQVLRRPSGRMDTTYLESVIEFSADSSTLIVRESTRDGRFHFVGYHAYDSTSRRFINWGADSYQTLGWAKGSADRTGIRFDGAVRFLTTGDTLAYHGHWRATGPNQHVYEATGVDPTNLGQMLKRDVYTRKAGRR